MIVRTINPHPYQCEYCHRTFARETTYERHLCPKRKKHNRFQTPNGQLAWDYYQRWMKYRRRPVHNRTDTFISSKFFNMLFLFVEHAKQTNIPDVDLFIRLMVQRDYPPVMWCSDDVYAEYLEFLDRVATPQEQLNITLRTLGQLSKSYDVDTGEIFDKMHPNELINYLKKRKLSPWVLLRSNKFIDFFKNRLTVEQRQIVKAIIRFDYWNEKFEQHREDLKIIDEAINVLQL